MSYINAGVNDVGTSSLACGFVINVSGRALGPVGNSSKAPGGVGLLEEAIEIDIGILLDEVNLKSDVSTQPVWCGIVLVTYIWVVSKSV